MRASMLPYAADRTALWRGSDANVFLHNALHMELGTGTPAERLRSLQPAATTTVPLGANRADCRPETETCEGAALEAGRFSSLACGLTSAAVWLDSAEPRGDATERAELRASLLRPPDDLACTAESRGVIVGFEDQCLGSGSGTRI